MEKTFLQKGIPTEKIVICDTLDFKKIIQTAKDYSEPGDVILLSPGCASFGMFKNFTQRGERFVEFVQVL